MSYIVILMSFQTIYSINYGGNEHSRPLLDQNFEKFRAPRPLQYIENFQRPPLMPETISVPPLTSSSPLISMTMCVTTLKQKCWKIFRTHRHQAFTNYGYMQIQVKKTK
jgi:hypothetical protein